MASMTIRLSVDPATGKKNIIISYTSDSDALPIEHEEEHRRLVDKLIEGGALRASEVGEIVVEREVPAGEAATREAARGEEQREAASHKG